mgnify:FL=1
MRKSRLFSRLAKLSLIFTYLIVLAGGFVRMTGSGMGCPDWPKCFGLLIPPTDEKKISWKQNHFYEKNDMLIHNDTLWVSKADFSSINEFNSKNWKKYEKHNYAKFNVFHTWAEYVNRLIGALTGLFVLCLFLISIFNIKNMVREFLFSFILVILFLVQAWIGGEVVFSVLNPFKITIHMFVALIIVCLLLILINLNNSKNFKSLIFQKKKLNFLISLVLISSLIQIYFGTQVREFIDSLEFDKSMWVLEIQNSKIYIHQILAIFVFIFNMYLCIYVSAIFSSLRKIPFEILMIFSTILILIISGFLMLNFNFPGLAQLIHLFAAFILFGAQFSLLLRFNYSYSPI